MLALVPFGLSTAAAGLSMGALAGGGYAIRTVIGGLEVSFASIRTEIWAPIVSATVMALALLPVDRLLLRPATHGVVIGLLLLALEGVLCILVYCAMLGVLAPRYLHEAMGIARHRPQTNKTRSPPRSNRDAR